jgi:hypothetical protein
MAASECRSEAGRPTTCDALAVPVAAVPGRYRLHLASARRRAVKVLYGEEEMTAVRRAAAQAGLRPAGYVATVALAHATGEGVPAAAALDRQLLAELLQARAAVQQHLLHLEQSAAANRPAAPATPWLDTAVSEADRAVARLDELARRLSRRLT